MAVNTIAPRGAIRNYDYARQQHDYSGMRFGNITPTDCDGEFDYQGKCFVYLEFKYGDWTLERWEQELRGQKLAFERKADSMTKPTLLVLAKHNHKAPDIIDTANATVVAYRINGKWRAPIDKSSTAHNCVEWFLKKFGYVPPSKVVGVTGPV